MDLKTKRMSFGITYIIPIYIFIVSYLVVMGTQDDTVTCDVSEVVVVITNISIPNTNTENECEQVITITTEHIVAPTPTPVATTKPQEFSKQDIALLERVTMSESGNQPFDGKVAVAQTVINRLHSGSFGDSISDVVYSKYQYSTADNGCPNDEVIAAVQKAINESPYPDDMIYFRQDYYHEWAVDYRKIGAHFFSLSN